MRSADRMSVGAAIQTMAKSVVERENMFILDEVTTEEGKM